MGGSGQAPLDIASMQLVYVSCPLCSSDRWKVLYRPWNTKVDPRDVLSASGGVRGTQTIVECTHCHLIYVNPRPRPDVVIESYTSAIDEVYLAAATGRRSTFREAVRALAHYAPRGKLLDVGCAAGFFVKEARDRGWDALGVEPCQWLASYGSHRLKVPIIPTTLAGAGFASESIDVVTMWDVLEHVPDPVSELREVFRILRPGGVLMVNFPDAGTLLAKIAGKRWWFLQSVHLTYFTQSTLQTMLAQVGFEDFAARPHYQSLEMGHLMKMAGLYSETLSRIGLSACRALRIARFPVRYYASQTNMVGRKPCRD